MARDIADFADLIPDDDTGMPVEGMRILRFIDDTGAPCVSFEITSDDDGRELLEWLGVLEWIQLRMYQTKVERD